MSRYLSKAPIDRIDVLMCENDALAFGAMDAPRFSFDLGVPSDLAFAGYAGNELAALDRQGESAGRHGRWRRRDRLDQPSGAVTRFDMGVPFSGVVNVLLAPSANGQFPPGEAPMRVSFGVHYGPSFWVTSD
jgi:hypothetical protein